MNLFLNKKIIKVEQTKDAPFVLTWVINNLCNNSCSYCPSILHNGKNYYYDFSSIEPFLKILFKKHPKIHCVITGGEPSLSPFILDVVKMFNDNGCTVAVTTNGVKSIDFWEKNSKYFSYIVFSYHSESPYNKNFIEKINASKKHTVVGVRIMMLPSKWDHCIEIYNKISQIEGINYEGVRLSNWNLNDKSFYKYTKDQIKWFEKNINSDNIIILNKKFFINYVNYTFNDGTKYNSKDIDVNDLINNDMTNFYGYECEVGLKSLFVNWDGKIYLGNCLVNGSIGNINFLEKIKWPKQKVICNKSKCHCTTDVNIDKKKSLNFIKILND